LARAVAVVAVLAGLPRYWNHYRQIKASRLEEL